MEITNGLNGIRKKRKADLEIQSMVYGKVPPQSKDAEEAIIGACLNQSEAINEVADMLTPTAFYVDAHQRIFRVLLNMLHKSLKIDIITTVNELKNAEELDIIGGVFALTELSRKVVSTAHLKQHANIVREKFLMRELVRIGLQSANEAYEDSTKPHELLKTVSTELYKLQSGSFKKDLMGLDSIVFNALVDLNEKMTSQVKGMTGITSGIADLDSLTGGWQKSDLIILAARPSVGKTALALKLAKSAANAGTPVAFFSLEMSTGQLILRVLSEESEVKHEKITRGLLSQDEYDLIFKKIAPTLSQRKIYFDDTASLNTVELRAKVRRAIEKFKVGLVILDYLQLATPADQTPGKTKNDSVGEISRDFKAIAKDFDVPFIALSQLSREVEKRTGNVPNLSDLRDSGAIEQDADLVFFLYNADGIRQLSCAKNRNGTLGKIKLSADLSIQRFSDYDSSGNTSAITGKKVVPLSEKLSIQKGNKMKSDDTDFDEGYNVDQPFN